MTAEPIDNHAVALRGPRRATSLPMNLPIALSDIIELIKRNPNGKGTDRNPVAHHASTLNTKH
ncbi:hypothetical protein MesoLj113a_45110 [Mesorhizobium sp. 113-1-2]|nr:hypothetical protein MesoLj113a_45110 [Mesorhizobium sp. 113-1-2]